jgi:hypothetical protein
MSVVELQFTLTFKVTYCCHSGCGTPIALPVLVYNRFLNDPSQWFHCCFGHSQHFTGPTEAEKLKSQLESAQRSEKWWQEKAAQRGRSAKAFKGQVTRIRNRVKNGVCPCCNRTFQNLMRHMATEHPEYATAEPHEKGDQ